METRREQRHLPPGMIDGPVRAPSSPPETPVPMKRRPCASTWAVRRIVSEKSELPPSMRMSPGSVCGSTASMNWSTGAPAFTRSMIRRGALSVAHISSIECAPTIFVPFASFARNSSTFAVVRLYAVTTKPLSFMLRMRFCPITARPITAMSEVRAGGAVAGAMFSFISAIGVVEGIAERVVGRGGEETFAGSSCVAGALSSRHTLAGYTH